MDLMRYPPSPLAAIAIPPCHFRSRYPKLTDWGPSSTYNWSGVIATPGWFSSPAMDSIALSPEVVQKLTYGMDSTLPFGLATELPSNRESLWLATPSMSRERATVTGRESVVYG